MKQLPEISARLIAVGLFVWLIITNMLVWATHSTGWWPFKVLLFLCISFLPGVILLRTARIIPRNLSVGVLYSFGLSLLVLILSGLATNQILYLFLARPLELAGILCVWDIVTALLITLSIRFNSQPLRTRRWFAPQFSKRSWLLLGCSIMLPCVAVLGAVRLNNGSDALLAAGTLCFAAVLIVYVFLLRRNLPDGLLAWFIFVLGLTILLMTSLRGWNIVGHDIEHEFRVYTLLDMYGRWDIGLNRDPYNACLSITILPRMFAQMLDVSGLVVFKFILQVIFAVCPAVVYVLLRRYTSKLSALTGSVLFICYPTFINDSAMLTRQGVAYLFFALALLVVSNQTQKKRYKMLFLACALGATLSHYSTAYMFVALFAGGTLCKLCITRWPWRRNKKLFVRDSTVLSPLFALLLFLMVFTWYSQITATSGGLATTIRQSAANIPRLFSSDNKSSDTSVALLFASNKTQLGLYDSYLASSMTKQTSGNVLAPEYLPVLTNEDAPLTKLGKKAQKIGIHPSYITVFRQNFAKILQLLAVVGVLYAAYRMFRGRRDSLGPDFIYLSIASIMLLALLVILPVLSINYGVLRAFQQALIFLILPITLLLAKLGQLLWPWLRITAATSGMLILFLLFTGFFAQMLGGSSPSLSMNNKGLYYGMFYATKANAQGFLWLKENIPENGDVRAANFNQALMHDPEYPFSNADILPSQLGHSTYVFLDASQVLRQKLYTHYENSPLSMTFPLGYYETKNHLYSTDSTGVYH